MGTVSETNIGDAVDKVGRHAVAIDLGGTSCRAALLNHRREVLVQTTRPTQAMSGAVLQQIVAIVRSFQSHSAVAASGIGGVCIGFPGVVHPASQQIRQAPHIAGADTFALGEQLFAALGIPVHLENDVNLAALAEWDARAADAWPSLANISLGTGLGCGLVVHGQLWRGRDGGAGELASMALGADSLEELRDLGWVTVGSCVEDIASGVGMARLYHLMGQTQPWEEAALSNIDHRTFPGIFTRAAEGESLAQRCLALVAREVAHAIVQLEQVMNLDLYVLAGGIGGRAEFRALVNQALQGTGLRIHASRFGGAGTGNSYRNLPTAGLAGAALMAVAAASASVSVTVSSPSTPLLKE